MRVGDDNIILDVESSDFTESAGGCAVSSDELGDDGEGLGGVDGFASSVEVESTHTVGVEIASISITNRRVSGTNTAIGTAATSLLGDRAGMTIIYSQSGIHKRHCFDLRSVGGRDDVGFPDIHLVTARSVFSRTGIHIIGVRGPSDGVGLIENIS